MVADRPQSGFAELTQLGVAVRKRAEIGGRRARVGQGGECPDRVGSHERVADKLDEPGNGVPQSERGRGAGRATADLRRCVVEPRDDRAADLARRDPRRRSRAGRPTAPMGRGARGNRPAPRHRARFRRVTPAPAPAERAGASASRKSASSAARASGPPRASSASSAAVRTGSGLRASPSRVTSAGTAARSRPSPSARASIARLAGSGSQPRRPRSRGRAGPPT